MYMSDYREPARLSRTLTFDLQTVSAPFASQQGELVCAWEAPDGKVAPLVLEVSPAVAAGAGAGFSLGLIAGVGLTTPASWGNHLSAALRIDYGAGASVQTRWIDPRAGRYQLPPCTYARVTFLKWNETAAPGPAGELTLGVGLTVGLVPDPSEATNTAAAATLAALAAEQVALWPGARYLTANAADTGIDFTVTGSGMVAVGTVTNASIYPPFPRWDIAAFGLAGAVAATSALIFTDISNAATANVALTQFIEF